ncbi:helix-turn-helix domain-containing protein [Brevundimonas diminuta]|uniref:helix-turn-helix domain-containing protein n=1 Tax=Brevundimonas diminuta TaxID=293 RepID=UPI003D9A6BFD
MKLSLAAMNGRALVAWNLKKLRTERGISQERLAADAGIDRAYLSEIERQLGNASVDLLDQLAGVLGVSISAFFILPEKGEAAPKSLPSGRHSKA